MARIRKGVRPWLAVGILALSLAGLSACGAGSPAPGGSAAATVQVSSNAKLGSILVDAKGMTLYRFTKDSVGKSNCSGTCAGIWPPLLVKGTPHGGSGVTGKLGTIHGTGGAQVTCNGYPLYRFSGDSAAGQTNGQGYLHLWHAVTPSCGLVPYAAKTSSSSSGTSGSTSKSSAPASKTATTSKTTATTGTTTKSGATSGW